MRQVGENLTQNGLEDLVRFFGSGLVGFGLIRVGLGFIIRAKIWPDPIGSFEIWPRFCRKTAKSHRISKDLDQILTDLEKILPNLV